MPTYNLTLTGGASAKITGTRPFARHQTGGENGAFEIVDNTGAVTNPHVGSQTAGTVYADNSAARAVQDDIVSAANNSPVNTVAPVITGTAQVGVQLATTGGTWTGTPAPTKTYQWKANGVAIPAATAANYTPVVGDIGKTITVTVTGTNTHGTGTGSVTSAATAAVIAA